MGIKFVVDLSPPEEGDEAVEMIEKLWCPDEVLSWKSHLEGYVEPDDPDVYQEQDMETGIADTNATGDWHPWHSNSSKQSSAVSALPSYSATRHTAAIERVLHILHGLDPRIHTTPMWYTVHKVAVQLQCTEAVQDYILSWLYGNLDFTESHPALVLGIAAEVQNQTLFRDTFALIVGTQALCGHIDNASDQATESDDKVPEPWRKPILFARRSLQAKLNRLYEHISSAAWLDNATMIPEYAKLVSPLNNPTVPQRWKKLAHDLDRAIRADIDVALTQLFSSPEDPGNPRSGLYRLPRDRQIYSRGYWQELQHLRQRVPVLGTEVMGLLSGWEGAAQGFLGDTQEPGTDIEVERMLERPIAEWYGWEEDGCEIAATHRQSVLEVRESQVNENRKGKSKAAFEPASEPDSQLSLSRTSSYKWFNDQATQRRKRMGHLKETIKCTFRAASQADEKSSSLLQTSPLVEPSHLTTTQLPKLGSINVPMNLPPSYYDTDNSLPCYSEHPISETALYARTCSLSPLRVKRKSCSDSDPWLDGLSSSEQNAGDQRINENSAENRTHVEMDEIMATACVLPRAERIEIINPISKRRCPVERCDLDRGENVEATHETHLEETQAGDPEVFRISGVYEALADEQTPEAANRWHVDEGTQVQDDVVRQIEGEVGAAVAREARVDIEFQDATNNVINHVRLVPAHVAAYWGLENVRERQAQRWNGNREETTVLDTEVSFIEEEETLEYDPDDTYERLTDHESDFLATSGHLLDSPIFYIPNVWYPLAVPARPGTVRAAEPSNTLQQHQPRQTIDVLSSTVGGTNTLPFPPIAGSALIHPSKIDIHLLWTQCLEYLKVLGAEALNVPTSFAPTIAGDGYVLVCLGDEEWKFMPLWAGGLDDGTGGVFGEFVAPPLDRGEDGINMEQGSEREREGEDTEVESLLGSYDDCMDVESLGSFETSGFSEFGNGGSAAEWSEFDDSEADEGQSDVETREHSEVESLGESTEGEDESDNDGFEDFGWEST